MIVDCFIDTNVFVYGATGRFSAPRKQAVALDLVENAVFGVSGQVLQEFFVAVTRRIKTPIPESEAIEWIDGLARRPVAPIDETLVKAAIGIAQRNRISYWDAAIVAAAQTLGAPVVYTEDLNHGQTIADVRIENPFL
jgi:predicted nucleic acid-binding protein